MDNAPLGAPGVNQIEVEKDSLIDDYISEMVEMAIELYEFSSEADAIDAVFTILDTLAEEGVIDKVPDNTAGEKSELIWVGKAQTLGLPNIVFQRLGDIE